MTSETTYLRRDAAAKYLKDKYGFGSVPSLAKWATYGGGPRFTKDRLNGAVTYAVADLDEYALARRSAPCASTSDAAYPTRRKAKG